MLFFFKSRQIQIDLVGRNFDDTTQAHDYKYFLWSDSWIHSSCKQDRGTVNRQSLSGLSKNLQIFATSAFEYIRMKLRVSNSINQLKRTDSDGCTLIIFFNLALNQANIILLTAFIFLPILFTDYNQIKIPFKFTTTTTTTINIITHPNQNDHFPRNIYLIQTCRHNLLNTIDSYKNQDKYISQLIIIKQSEMLTPSLITTLLTIFIFVLGLLPIVFASYVVFFITVCVTTLVAYLLPQFNHLSRLQLFKCLITMYIFGIVDGYVWVNFAWNLGHFDAFKIFLCISTVRYYGEFQLVNCFHHHELSWESFLIYHSKMYVITNVVLLLEHVITRYVLDLGYKQYNFLMFPALIVTILSTILRILAFFTAKSNFTHKVSYSKKASHTLVTHGIYSIFRHPSYTGFFYYTVSSMVLIGNFFSAIMFGLMLSIFFEERIEYEEHYLLKFFGEKYQNYRKSTHVFIPYLPKFITDKLPVMD